MQNNKQTSLVRVVDDAMGGDYGPQETVKGAIEALDSGNIEIILVGDQNFSRKCHVELFEKRADRAMVLASHSIDVVREYCNRAVIIDRGMATAYEDVNQAVDIYGAL